MNILLNLLTLVAMFPNAPTERGRKHLLELIKVRENIGESGVLFLIQMNDVNYFKPNDSMDKLFGDALREAYNNGVDVFAYNCDVRENYISLLKKVTVIL